LLASGLQGDRIVLLSGDLRRANAIDQTCIAYVILHSKITDQVEVKVGCAGVDRRWLNNFTS
jgi:hypothetical protein